MIRNFHALVAAPLLALAVPAAAQDAPAERATENLDRMAEALSDPARQEALAASLSVMAEVLLDLPLAPILEPLAEAAGEDTRKVDPDATLRKIAPGAGVVSGEIRDKLPMAMERMASMTGAFARMVPALRDMAEQMERALPVDVTGRE